MFVRDSKMLNRFKRFFVIDSLHISNFLLVEQMNQINVQNNRNQKTSYRYKSIKVLPKEEGLVEIRDN